MKVDAEAIFLLGDLFDFWFEYKTVVLKGFVRVLGKLAEIRDSGIPIYFFVGNHDLWMHDYFEKELNIPVYHDNKEFTFKQKEHLIRLFSANTYSQIKGDQIITVRTPKQFIDDYFMWLILFFIAWWFLHIYWSISNINTDQLIVPILMFLSGICILIMYAISNPLTDTSKGNEMAFGSILGIIVLGI